MALSTTLIFLMTSMSLSVLSHRMAGFTVMVLNSVGLFNACCSFHNGTLSGKFRSF